MSSFADKTAIVTGGASGIGERVAEDIVAQGGNVVIGDVNGDLEQKLSSRLGPTKATFVELDVSRSSDAVPIYSLRATSRRSGLFAWPSQPTHQCTAANWGYGPVQLGPSLARF
jgi:NAD(P)-dependent dehydrogenase (short-subunit alcohol dehydrogenase family)